MVQIESLRLARRSSCRAWLSLAVVILSIWHSLSAAALVGGAATVRDSGVGRHIVMIVGTRGNLCTGTALARDLVLTAAHCVAPAATYRVITPDVPSGFAIRQIAVHPRYSRQHYVSGTVTADVALIKLATPLPGNVIPATLGTAGNVAAGDRFVIAGFGTTAHRSDDGVGTPRAASLIATGKPGTLQIRLADPEARNARAGLGACTGDSGGPVFQEAAGPLAVIGVVSWSTGPVSSDGCGGLTGVTPLALYRGWIVETAGKMGSAIWP